MLLLMWASLVLFLGGIVLFSFIPWLGITVIVLAAGLFVFSRRSGIFTFMANMSYAKGGLDGALPWLGRAYRAGGLSTDLRITYAYQLIRAEDLESAEQVIHNVLAKLTGKGKGGIREVHLAQTYQGLLLWRQGKKDEALEILRSLHLSGYKTAALYGILGYFYLEKENPTKALQFNREAYDYDSKDPVILDNLGANHLITGNLDKAAQIYGELVERKPTFPEPYFHFAQVLAGQKEWGLALEMAEKALDRPFNGLSTIEKSEVEKLRDELSQNKS